MARRTKKQKVNAHHTTLINWRDLQGLTASKSRLTEAGVNRQNKSMKKSGVTTYHSEKRADYMEKDENLVSIRIDLIKSVLISVTIIGFEIVLYLFWV